MPLIPPRPQSSPTLPRVAVLMCTMQGQHFLADQLNSIAIQTHPAWSVWVSDDGSDDLTHTILEHYRVHWGHNRLSIHDGPAEGSTANFLSLTCRADIEADYFAYADQDDVWEADKLERAVRWLQTIPADVPALYTSRTQLVDERNQHLGYSPLFRKAPGFANALVQNVGGGNTMVFNRAARQLLREAGDQVNVVAHDWWAYILISGAGGAVHYDPHPTVRYRQHDNNQVGANTSWSARLVRLQMLLKGRFRQWNEGNLQALEAMEHRLTNRNRAILRTFRASRVGESPLARLAALFRSGVYRQTALGHLGLWVAAVLRRH